LVCWDPVTERVVVSASEMNINEGHDRTVASDEDLPREGRCCTRATPRCAAPPPTS